MQNKKKAESHLNPKPKKKIQVENKYTNTTKSNSIKKSSLFFLLLFFVVVIFVFGLITNTVTDFVTI